MTAANLDLTFEQGAKFDFTLQYLDSNGDPIDLTGRGARMDVVDDNTGATLITLNTTNGRIILTELEGKIQLLIGATDIPAPFDSASYDLELPDLTDADDVIRLVQGSVSYSKEKTTSTDP